MPQVWRVFRPISHPGADSQSFCRADPVFTPLSRNFDLKSGRYENFAGEKKKNLGFFLVSVASKHPQNFGGIGEY